MTKFGNRLQAFMWFGIFVAIAAVILGWYGQRFFAGDPMVVLQNLPPLNAATAFYGLVGFFAGMCFMQAISVGKKALSGEKL